MMQERETLFLFLPAGPGGAIGWARAVDGRFVAHGRDWVSDGFDAGDAYQVALAPVAVTGMALVDLPALAPAQAAAAARLALADRLALAEGAVTLGVAGGDGPRAAFWVKADWLKAMRAGWSAAGLNPQALVPAAALVTPAPEQAVRLHVDEERLVVTASAAWRDDPLLNEAMGCSVPVDLDSAAVEAALRAAVLHPPCDLLTGARQPTGGIWAAWQAVAALLLALLIVSALIPVGRALAQHRAADRLEDEARQIAHRAFPEAPDPLAALGGASAARFGDGYALIARAVEAVPSAELSALSFAGSGFQARVRVTDAAARDALLRQLNTAGLVSQMQGETREQGRLSVALRVDAP